MVKVRDLGSRECEFESRSPYFEYLLFKSVELKLWSYELAPLYACIAQLVEQLFCKQQVVGSYPAIGSKYRKRVYSRYKNKNQKP